MLPESAESLSTIERWLMIAIFVFAVLSALSGFFAYQIRQQRATLEKEAIVRELAGTRQELSTAKDELSRKNKAIEELADEARKKALEIEARQAPRKLRSEEKDSLVQLLRGRGGVPVIVSAVIGDAEAIGFAKDLLSALEAAGWKVTGVDQLIYTGSVPAGLIVAVGNAKAVPPEAIYLIQSLRKSGLEVAAIEKPNLSPGVIELLVGTKPQ